MLMNRKGQIGPQGLEDVPMAVMAFMACVASIIIFIGVTSGHLAESRLDDMHDTGKRLVETLSGDLFKSELSRSYGDGVLDGALIEGMRGSDLKNTVGSVEYAFWAEVSAAGDSYEFGEQPPETSLAYGGPVSVLLDGGIVNGEIRIRIWRR